MCKSVLNNLNADLKTFIFNKYSFVNVKDIIKVSTYFSYQDVPSNI